MMQIGLNHFLILSAILFSIGLYGTLAKKNAVAVLMGIELMLNAVNINFVAFSKYITPGLLTGQIFSIFVVVIAAAEVTVGLALVISIYRDRLSVNMEDFDWLKW